jgi:hypothetical protein
MDRLFSEIPIIGLFSGYVFNPAFVVMRSDSTILMSLEKPPSFFSRKFTIKQLNQLSEQEEMQALLSLLMMILLERSRG